MSYADLREEMGRQPVYLVEIDLDYCTHIYGTSPCTAAVGVTGPIKCFNARKTCQDAANYEIGTKTYRFSNRIIPATSDLDFVAIPCVAGISMAPTLIDPINGIGKRANVVVTLNDFQASDDGIDKYVDERGYDSATRSTFFLKLLTRNPYYQNRVIRVKVGYLVDGEDPDPANFETRVYLIQSIDGPNAAGQVKITAQDPLKLLDDDRAKSPLANTGSLLTDILAADLTATLDPAGVGDDEYPASGVLAIENEIVNFTRTADVLTLVRAQRGTVASDHSSGTSVQACQIYPDGSAITDVLYDLLVNKAGIPAAYITLADWEAEAETWLSDYRIGTLISKPIGCNQLVGELAQQCLFYIWWDERQQQILFRAVRPFSRDTPTAIDDTNSVLADSQSRTETPDDRQSQIWIYFGQLDPTQDLAKAWNFQNLHVSADPDAESPQEYDDSRIKVIYSRWLLTASYAEAQKLGDRLLLRYRDNPKTFVLKLDAKDAALWTGDIVLASIRSIIDMTGAVVPTVLQILEVQETVPGSEYMYTLQDTEWNGRYAFFTPDDAPIFADATDDDKKQMAFFCGDDGKMPDGTDGYLFI